MRVGHRSYRYRRLPYTVIVGLEPDNIRAYTALGALRKAHLKPGAKVTVWVHKIVQPKRIPAFRGRAVERDCEKCNRR